MIVLFRNFFRNKMVNLTVKSIRHFLPDVKIASINLYKESAEEYNTQEPLHSSVIQYFAKTAFVNSTGKPQDHSDSTKTAGYQNIDNGKYFVEGYNLGHHLFFNVNEPVLMLAEDHFFTTGAVLKELTSNDYDLAYAPWDGNLDANGSILCINFYKLSHLFALTDVSGPIEKYLQDRLVTRVDESRRYAIINRRHANYFGDGMYTNSSEEIERELKKAGIL